jgi:hypothetical protein
LDVALQTDGLNGCCSPPSKGRCLTPKHNFSLMATAGVVNQHLKKKKGKQTVVKGVAVLKVPPGTGAAQAPTPQQRRQFATAYYQCCAEIPTNSGTSSDVARSPPATFHLSSNIQHLTLTPAIQYLPLSQLCLPWIERACTPYTVGTHLLFLAMLVCGCLPVMQRDV